jgi:putative endonuclease
MHYVYVLYSKKLNKKYIGRTGNLKSRMEEHNNGKVPFTSRGLPWVFIHYQAFLYKDDAVAEELFLKTGKGRERIKFLLKNTLERFWAQGPPA